MCLEGISVVPVRGIGEPGVGGEVVSPMSDFGFTSSRGR